MSHVSTMDMTFKSLESLKEACKELGLEFRENQKTYKWYGRWVNDYHGDNAAYKNGIKPEDYGKCDHAIGIPDKPGAYEIGVVERDGEYVLVWDFYSGGFGLKDKIGDDGKKLKHAYTVAHSQSSLEQNLKSKGFRKQEVKKLAGNKTQIIYRRG